MGAYEEYQKKKKKNDGGYVSAYDTYQKHKAERVQQAQKAVGMDIPARMQQAAAMTANPAILDPFGKHIKGMSDRAVNRRVQSDYDKALNMITDAGFEDTAPYEKALRMHKSLYDNNAAINRKNLEYVPENKDDYDKAMDIVRRQSKTDEELADEISQARSELFRTRATMDRIAKTKKRYDSDFGSDNRPPEDIYEEKREKYDSLVNEAVQRQKNKEYNELRYKNDFADIASKGRQKADAEEQKKHDIKHGWGFLSNTSSMDDVTGVDQYEYMTDDEKDIYGYLLEKEGSESADEYKKSIIDNINSRKGQALYEAIPDNAAVKIASGLGAGYGRAKRSVMHLVNDIAGAEALPVSAEEHAASMVRESLGKKGPKVLGSSLGQAAYDVLENTGNMVPSIAAGYAGGPIAAAATVGVSSGASAMNEEWRNGASKGQAAVYGAVNGALEGGLQYALGGISKLGGKLTGVGKGILDTKISNVAARTAAKAGLSALGEGTEEYLQEIIDPVVRNLTLGEDNKIRFVTDEALYVGMLGAVSGLALGGPSDISEELARTKITEYVGSGTDIEAVVGAAKQIKELKPYVEKYEKSPTDYNAGMLKLEFDNYVGKEIANAKTPEEADIIYDRITKDAPDEVVRVADEALSNVKQGLDNVNTDTDNVNADTDNINVNTDTGNSSIDTRNSNIDTEIGNINTGNGITDTGNRYTSRVIDTFSKETRNAMEQSLHTAVVDEVTYKNAFANYYSYGRAGLSMETADGNATFNELTDAQKVLAYRSGVQDRQAQINRAEQNLTKKGFRGQGMLRYIRDNELSEGISVPRAIRELDERQKSSVMALRTFAEVSGQNIVLYESQAVNGKVTTPNGWYNRSNDTIYIDVNAGDVGESAILRTASHEITHAIKEWSPKKYAELQNFVTRQFEQDGSIEAMINEEIRIAKSNGQDMTLEEALDEVVANSCEMMLKDTGAIERMAAESPSLCKKIKLVIDKVVSDIKKAFEGLRSGSLEHKRMNEILESWSEVQKLWDDAAVDSARNAKKARKVSENAQRSAEAESKVYDIRKQFFEDYDNWDGKNPRVKFNIGNTSKALKEIGVKQADIIIDSSKLIKIKNKHSEMTDEIIKKIPELLEHPYLIMESKSVAGRIVVYGDVVSDKGPVMVALELNPTKKGLVLDDIIKVASTYTRNNTQNYINNGSILWIYNNKNKTNDWLKRTRLQLPVGISQYGLIKSITPNTDNVNSAKNDKKARKVQETTGDAVGNVYSYRGDMSEVEYGMKEEERYKILSNAKINVVDGNMQLTENELNNLGMDVPYRYESFFKLLGDKFGIYKGYKKGNIEFYYSKSSIKESVNKIRQNPKNNEELVAMIANTKDILENAIPIQIHDDKYAGTIRADKRLKNIYVMMGIFENKGSLYPVEIVVKNRVDGKNNLYMEVVLNAIDKIKGNEISSKAAEKNQRHSPPSFPYEVNITDVIRNVNSEDAKFLKYFPKKMLSKEQLVNVEEATEKDSMRDNTGKKLSPEQAEYHKAAMKRAIKMDAVTDISTDVFMDKSKTIRQQINEYYDSIGNVAHNKELGDITLDNKSIKDDIAHGIGRDKVISFKGVKDVIEKGEIIDYKKNWKNRGYDTAVIVAPVNFKEGDNLTKYDEFVIVRLQSDTKKAYVHEVLSIKQEKVLFKTWNLGKDTAVTPGNTSSHIFKLIQEYVNVKYNEVLNQDAAKDIVNNLNEKGYGVSIDEIIDNTDNNQYSYRGDMRSDREILADALMSATKNNAERNELEAYKKIIGTLDMQEKLRREKVRLRNAAETAQERDRYQADIDKIDKKIAFNDKKLIKMEAAAPLRAVIKREAKADSQKDIEYIKARHKERQERKTMTTLRNNIKNNAGNLIMLINKPTNQRHVPEALKKPVADFLGAVDFISAYADPESFNTKQWQTKMEVLRHTIDSLNSGESTSIDFDPDLLARMKAFSYDSDGKPLPAKRLSDMGMSELEDMYIIVRSLRMGISNANRMFANKRSESAEKLGADTVGELSARKDKKNHSKLVNSIDNFINVDLLDPTSFFRSLGKNAESVGKELRAGRNVQKRDIRAAREYMDGVYDRIGLSGKEFEEITGDKKVHTFKYPNGEFKMTTGEIMSLYCLKDRKRAMQHMIKGGITVDDFKYKGKVMKQTGNFRMTEAFINEITSVLTEKEKRVAEAMQSYMANQCAEQGNETSMTLYGYKKFNEKEYFPISADKNWTRQNTADGKVRQSLTAIVNVGMTKELNEKAENPIRVSNIYDVFSKHVADMADYHGLAVPLVDASKWYNYVDPDSSGDSSVKQAIKRVFGKEYLNYYTNFIRDINGDSRRRLASDLTDTFIKNFKATAVAANMRVVVQQPTAYVRAAAMMDTKYLMKAVTMKPGTKEAVENSEIAWWKSEGFFDTGLGPTLKALITNNKSTVDKIVDKSLYLAGKADDITWGCLWNAVKLEVADKNKGLDKNSPEYMEKVKERFEDIVYSTQVVDDLFSKSQIMRHTDGATRSLTSFMAEPIKTYNMLRNAVASKAPKAIIRTSSVFVVSAAANAALAAVVDAMRSLSGDDDKDKGYGERWMDSFLQNMADNANPLNLVPYLRDLVNACAGYSSNKDETVWMTSTVKACQEIYKAVNGDSKKTPAQITALCAKAISQMSGIPVANAFRTVDSIYNEINATVLGKKSLGYYAEKAAVSRMEGDIKEYESIVKSLQEDGYTLEDINKKVRSHTAKLNKSEKEAEKATAEGDEEPDTGESMYKAGDVLSLVKKDDITYANEVMESMFQTELAGTPDRYEAYKKVKASLKAQISKHYKTLEFDDRLQFSKSIRKLVLAKQYIYTNNDIKTLERTIAKEKSEKNKK